MSFTVKIMKEVKEYLLNYQDLKYLEFNRKLNIAKNQKYLGVRLPIIKKYASFLLKKYSIDYLLNNIDNEYYDMILLKGFIIGKSANLSYDELIYYLELYLPLIVDWSMCDSFASSLKIVSKYYDRLWEYLLEKLKSKNEFIVRFALVMFLNYYIKDDYKERIYYIIGNIHRDEFYIKMATAWLLSYMFVAYFDDTIIFVQNNNIDKWIVLKGITKAIESHKISYEQKKELQKLRESIK